MKRDMDLVREVLIYAEEQDEPWGSWDLKVGSWTEREIRYHICLCDEAELLVADLVPDTEDESVDHWAVRRLTFKGHEYLDSIRPQAVWDRIKDQAKNRGIELTIDSIKLLAFEATKSFIFRS